MKLYCTYCGCPTGLHNDIGCACEDDHGHERTLIFIDGDTYCQCERTLDEFKKYEGWSTDFRFYSSTC